MLRPGRFTELFFLDDATALAAGHRPCALCRREDYARLAAALRVGGADAIDARLHEERIDGHERRLHDAIAGELPDGAFVLEEGAPRLVRGGELLTWTPDGYAERTRVAAGARVRLLTPPSLVELLRTGWTGVVPLLHPSSQT